jgi:hypothetical protein
MEKNPKRYEWLIESRRRMASNRRRVKPLTAQEWLLAAKNLKGLIDAASQGDAALNAKVAELYAPSAPKTVAPPSSTTPQTPQARIGINLDQND